MKIGIDIDGVLTNEHDYIINNGTKYFAEKNIPYNVSINIYDSPELFNVSKENYNMFWGYHLIDYFVNIPTRQYAKEIIKKLKEEGNEIYIITARPFTYTESKFKEDMINITKEWLAKNEIYYDELVFSNTKLEDCNRLGIDIMIEDKPTNILSVSKSIPVICYDQPYNKEIIKENIYRCYSWYDIYKFLKAFNK